MIRRRAAQLGLAVRAGAAVVTARCVLRLGGFPAALRFYRLVPVDEAPAVPQRPVAPILGAAGLRTVYRTLRLPVLGSTCLPSALALSTVLRQRGAVPDLVIGVASDDGDFSAHAWVEIDGRRLDVSGVPPAEHRELARFRPPTPPA